MVASRVRSVGQRTRAKGVGRKKRTKSPDQKIRKNRSDRKFCVDRLDREADQLVSGMKTLKLHSPEEAPVSWMSLFKLSMVAAIERQIAVSLGRDPLPSIKQIVAKSLAEVKEARSVYIRTHSGEVPRWEFDKRLKKVIDQILSELADDAKFQMAQIGQKFNPNFSLANAAMPSTARHCKILGIPHGFKMESKTLM